MNAPARIQIPEIDAQSSSGEHQLHLDWFDDAEVAEVDRRIDPEPVLDAWKVWIQRNLQQSSQDRSQAAMTRLFWHHTSYDKTFKFRPLLSPFDYRIADHDVSETLRNTLAHPQGTKDQYPYDSRHIANWFIRRAERDGKSMSVTRVLKLVYMAHGWTLAVLDRPLIMDRIEAWEYGPVIPTVYHAFRPQDVRDLSPFSMYERYIESEIEEVLEDVYRMYAATPDRKLSRLTRVHGGPWDITYGRGNRYKEIPNKLITKHYRNFLEGTQSG